MNLAALVLIAIGVPESSGRAPGSIDVWGAALLAGALSCILLTISETRTGTLPILVLVGALGILALGGFVLRELRTADPLIELRLLKNPAVLTADIAGLLVGFALYGAFSVIPQFVQTPTALGYGFGATSLQAGLLLLPTAATMVLVGPAAGRLGARLGHAKILLIAGVLGVIGYAILVAAVDSVWAILASTTILGIAVGLALTAAVNLLVGTVAPSVTGQATGLNTILRTIGGSLGAQVAAALISSTAVTSTPEVGYRIAFGACGAALALVAVIAGAVVKRSRQ